MGLPTASRTVFVLVTAAVLVTGCRSTSTNVTGPSSAKCAISLSGTGLTVPGGGGTGTVGISVNRECSWTATSQAAWIAMTGPTSGQGPATLTFSVGANPAAAVRRSAIVINQQRVDIQQDAAACEYAIAPASSTVPSGGGEVRVAVTALPGCAWTSESQVPWATVADGATGNGSGTVVIAVAANTGQARTGTVSIAGRPFAITQAAAQAVCTFAAVASPNSFAANGGSGALAVTTAAGCEWTATSNAPWVTLTGGASGTGSGTVGFQVEPNTGAARTATISVGGQLVPVTQASGQVACSYAVSPRTRDVPAAGGSGEFDVATGSLCTWTAASTAAWLSVTRGSSGTGNGRVGFTAAANTGAARIGTMSVAGETVSVSQPAAACSYTVSPSTVNATASGGAASVSLDTAPACGWTATSGVPWVTITSAASGAGPAVVSFTVAGNPGASREGTLSVGGQPVTVRQDGTSCSFTVSPGSVQVVAGGGSVALDVSTSPLCAWTANSSVAWVSIASGASGTGPGRVTVAVLANTAVSSRAGSVTVAGQNIPVTQAGASCSFSVSPVAQTIVAAGGTGTVTVTTSPGCAWSAASGVPWITITSGTSGSGDGTVAFSVAVNTTGAARSGSMTVAGQTVTVNQQ